MCDTFFTHALLFLFLLSTYFVYLFSNFIYRMLPSSSIAVTLDFEVLLILHGSELAWKQSRHVQQWQKRDWGTARGSVQLESFRGELKLASSSVFDLFQDGGDVTRIAAA